MTNHTGREDTDEALSVERRITDEGMDRWRADHADDGVHPPRSVVPPVPPILNWLMIVVVVLALGVMAQQQILSNSRQADFNKRQIESVQQQNDAQLCAQYNITIAVRKIGSKLGLPVSDIVPPDVEGISCP